jgi:hypothetical protein
MAWQPEQGGSRDGVRAITLRLHGHGAPVPDGAALHAHTDGFRVFEQDESSYVSDGASTLHVRHDGSAADAYLDESFHQHPRALQWQFWSFCLLKLLRPAGYFSLHAAALVSPGGTGVLIIGPSGSGKTTLAVGLIRAGWGYLSDDAVLLCRRRDTLSAVSLRTQFYVDADAASSYADLRVGHAVADTTGGLRRQLHIDDHHAHHRVSGSVPKLLLFPTIVDEDSSTVIPLDAVSTLSALLAASGPQLFDRLHMAQHLAALRSLLRQAVAYRLDAGRDLHRRPDRLVELIPCRELL